ELLPGRHALVAVSVRGGGDRAVGLSAAELRFSGLVERLYAGLPMRCAQALILVLAWSACASHGAPADYARLGERALDYTAQAVAFGPRPAGSEANRKQREWIVERLRATGCTVVEDAFEASTPLGPRQMANIL